MLYNHVDSLWNGPGTPEPTLASLGSRDPLTISAYGLDWFLLMVSGIGLGLRDWDLNSRLNSVAVLKNDKRYKKRIQKYHYDTSVLVNNIKTKVRDREICHSCA